jgi:hypothetical protein
MIHLYEECNECKYISECPHPVVDEEGHPIPPDECQKKDKIILKQKEWNHESLYGLR